MEIERQHKMVSAALAFVLSIFFIYAFWYQYVYNPIGMGFPLIGGMILFLSLCNLKWNCGFYNYLLPVFVFVAYVAVFGLIESRNVATSRAYVLNICEYLIPMIGVYTYVDSDYKKLLRILKMLVISIMMIAFSSLLNGHVTNTGAIIVGTLNANVESSLLALGTVSAIIIFSSSQTKFYEKMILAGAILLFIKTQIDCASRRGFVVLLFLILTGMLVVIQTKYKDNKLIKWLILLIAICALLVIITTLSETFEGSVLFERFSSKANEGDRLRKIYQAKALTLFLQSPLFGTGLGYVEIYVGMYSHSMYHELLACTGIIGTFILVGNLIFYMLRLFSDSFKIDNDYCDLKICARSMMLFVGAILLGGFAVVYIYDMYFYVILGVIAASSKVIRYNLQIKLRESEAVEDTILF